MIEKKLILCSILAIAIGIATIVPVEYFTSTNTQVNAQTLDQPWFNVNIPYGYWTANATNDQNGKITYGEGYYIALNITTNPEAITLSNGRIEYYQIQVYSDLGQIANFTFFISANCTGTTNPYETFTYSFQNYLNTSATDNQFVFFSNFNGTLPTTAQGISQIDGIDNSYTLTAKDQAISGFGDSFSNGLAIQGINMTGTYMEQQLQQISNIQNAHTVYVDISRIGYITMDANSTTATPANTSIIQHVELTPYNGGFLYNTLIPQDQLAQTNLEAPTIP